MPDKPISTIKSSINIQQASKYVWKILPLAIILIVAVGSRFWGIGFGLPYTYHIDEPAYVSAALNLGAGKIGRQLNPTALPNLLFIEYVVLYILGHFSGAFISTTAFEQFYRSDPTMFFLLGRITSGMFGVLNVLFIYLIGRQVKGRLTGLLAALFLSLAFLHVRDSHFAVPDIMATSLVSLSVLLCVLSVKYSNRRYLYLAAAVSGFTIASKWSVWPLIVPIFIALYYNLKIPSAEKFFNRKYFHLIFIFVLFLVGFAVGGFQLFLQPASYFNDALRELRSGQAGGFGVWQIDTVSGWIFYLRTLVYGIGILLLVFAIIGAVRNIVLALRQRNRTIIIVLCFPIIYYLIMGSTRHYFARYSLPLIPFMVFFAADVIVMIFDWINFRRTNLAWAVLSILTLFVIAQPLADSLRLDFLLTQIDTRTIAKQWVEANIPSGSKIALDWPVHGPPLSTSDEIVPDSTRVYDVSIEGDIGLPNHPTTWYQQQGYDYLIASSFIYNIPTISEQTNLQRETFYNNLNSEFQLVQEFKPYGGTEQPKFIFDEIYGPAVSLWQRDRPGPTIKIYRVPHSP